LDSSSLSINHRLPEYLFPPYRPFSDSGHRYKLPLPAALARIQLPQIQTKLPPSLVVETLPALRKKETTQKKPSAEVPKSYTRRNVCKSILRHIFHNIKKDHENLIKVIEEVGFKDCSAGNAFLELLSFFDINKQKQVYEHAQVVIEKILESKTIHTIILKDSLSKMLEELSNENYTKVKGKNLETYRMMCKFYYERAIKVIQDKLFCSKSIHINIY
jgi:hypothetical protein